MVNGRSPTEMVVKSVAIHLACMTAFGHLGSLRQVPVREQVYDVLACVVWPTLPLAQLIINASLVVRTARSQPPHSPPGWKYYASAILGVYALPHDRHDEPGAPLSWVGRLNSLDCERQDKYDVRWAARLFTLILLLGEAMMSLILWIRRLSYWHLDIVRPPWPPGLTLVTQADTLLDNVNAVAVFGTAVTAITSIAILALNCKWTAPYTVVQEAARDPPGMRSLDARWRGYLLAFGLQAINQYRNLATVAKAYTLGFALAPVATTGWLGWIFSIGHILAAGVVSIPVASFAALAVLLPPFDAPRQIAPRRLVTHQIAEMVDSGLVVGCICGTTYMITFLTIYFTIKVFEFVQECQHGPSHACLTPYMLWADPWSNRFMTF